MTFHPSDGLRGPVASGLYFDHQLIRPFDFGADGSIVGDDVIVAYGVFSSKILVRYVVSCHMIG